LMGVGGLPYAADSNSASGGMNCGYYSRLRNNEPIAHHCWHYLFELSRLEAITASRVDRRAMHANKPRLCALLPT